MHILRVSAINFKTLCNFEINFLNKYCAISGQNNSGKTSVIKIIEFFLKNPDDDPYGYRSSLVKYVRDKTQWSDGDNIDLSIELAIFRDSDSEVFGFIERFVGGNIIESDQIVLKVRSIFHPDGGQYDSCYVDGAPQDDRASAEIIKKLRSTNNIIVHNSTESMNPYVWVGGSFVEILEAHFSSEDKKNIDLAQKNLQSKIRKAARQHKSELDSLLGKLKDKYQVELSAIGGERASKYPLQIKLQDKVSEVPLQEWGAGTRNRTRVLMSILDAQHLKASASDENRTNPIFLVEEPESFLHPSAQAEFGQILNSLAEDFGIQIIATTHSPYMLNQSDASANYLLERRVSRKHPRETILKESVGDDWMAPFAENLGVVSSEFHDWKQVFTAQSARVVLVEGDIDKSYFEIFQSKYPSIYKIPSDVEIVPYEGKDALKNTALLRFMINKFKRVFITFDLDAAKEVGGTLGKIGLIEGNDFLPVGIKKPGCEFIEGLVPDKIRQSVHVKHIDDVNAMMSQDNGIRRSARQRLKKAYLEEFSKTEVSEVDLSSFKSLFLKISKAF